VAAKPIGKCTNHSSSGDLYLQEAPGASGLAVGGSLDHLPTRWDSQKSPRYVNYGGMMTKIDL